MPDSALINNWAKIAPEIKANQNRNVDSINKTHSNGCLGAMAPHGASNPKTSTLSISRDQGKPEWQMTNRCLLFTQCAITVKIFSAQSIMHYLLGLFFLKTSNHGCL